MPLGWIAGGMIVGDRVSRTGQGAGDWLQYAAPVAGALFVLLLGSGWRGAPCSSACRPRPRPSRRRCRAVRRVLLAVDGLKV